MDNKSSLFLLIDGNALVHRAFHALPPLTVPKTGETVGAVYGFALMLVKALNELKPTHYAIAFDRKAPTFRHELYDQYKAHRPQMPDELASQLGRVREVVAAFNIPVFEKDGYEADDFLGALSQKAENLKIPVVILTGDADMMQLVSPGIKVFYPKPGGSFSDAVLYDEEAVKLRYGVSPAQIADLKALKGDTSDNIPGVPGVGEKTALKLIQQFGSVKNLLSRLDEIEPAKLKDKVKDNVESLKRSYELALIVKDVDFEFDLDLCCQLDRYDRDRAAGLFRELGFNSLVSKLPGIETAKSAPVAAPVEVKLLDKKYSMINTADALDELIRKTSQSGTVALSVEGSAFNPIASRIVGISLSFQEGEAFYIPVVPDQQHGLSPELVLNRLRPLFESNSVEKSVHNSKYDVIILAEYGIALNNLCFDPMVAGYLLGDKSLELKDLVYSRTGYEVLGSTALTGSGAKQIPLFQVDIQQVADFACSNADMTLRMTSILKKELEQVGLENLFTNVELPLVPVLAHMERCGVLLDISLLREMSARLGEQLAVLEQEIFSLAGQEFNINSPAQLSVVLFEKMHLPGKKVRGKYSTEASILEDLRGYDIVGKILEYRQLIKLKSTYIDALPCLINEKTGRVHTSFNQTRTATGRLSSSEPNLQNIPVRGELGREIRRAFIAPEGSVLMAGDYSQIDLRSLAHLSQDERLLDAFLKNEDIHAATAAQIFGVEMNRVEPDMRRLAKTVNFGVIYGMSEYGLEQATDLSREEAGKFIKAYFEKYPGVAGYLEKTRGLARRNGYVQTILGRRRYIQEINAANRIVRESAERMAINMPVQGTSSDIIKIAMIDLHREIKRLGLKSRMLLQVHDELIFEVPHNEVTEMDHLVRQKMCGAIELSVPLKVDIKTGPNWGAME